MTTYTAICWRDRPFWYVYLPELHRTGRVDRLSQAPAAARDMVLGAVAGAEKPEVVLDVRVPEDLVRAAVGF